MPLWRNTDYVDVYGSPVEGYRQDDGKAMRKVNIADSLAARNQAAVDFIGFSQMLTAPTGANYIARSVPHQYGSPSTLLPAPDNGLSPFMITNYAGSNPGINPGNRWCTGVERTEPLGTMHTEATGPLNADLLGVSDKLVQLELQYQNVMYPILPDSSVIGLPPDPAYTGLGFDNPLAFSYPDEGSWIANNGWVNSRYVLREVKPGGVMVKLPVGYFKYLTNYGAAAPQICPEKLAIYETVNDVFYSWHNVPQLGYPEQAIQKALGRVNGWYFDNFPPMTLLFLNSSYEYHLDVTGQVIFNVKYHMKYTSRLRRTNSVPGLMAGIPQYSYLGWQGEYRNLPVGAGMTPQWDYDVVTSDGTGLNTPKSYKYLTWDFSRLFRPDNDYAQPETFT